MGKSLTETAKAILMKEEGAYPSVSSMGAGHPDRDAKMMTSAKSSLKPNAGYVDGQIVNPGSTSTTGNQAQDLGPALVKNTDVSPPSKAAGSAKKDSSAASQSRKGTVPSEKSKKQSEVMEEEAEEMEEGIEVVDKGTGAVVGGSTGVKPKPGPGGSGPGMAGRTAIKEEEEIELSEELESFIDQCIAEGMSEDEIASAIEENFEIVEEKNEEEEDEEDEDDNEEENKKMNEESAMKDYEVNMQEDIDALFAGEELSEEFKQKAKTIFESAVKRKIEEELTAIEEAYANTLEEQIANIHEELSTNVDDYLNYVVENWMSENEVAIEAGLRTELTEDFISNLKSLFEEHYIDIPEEKVSVVEELGNKVEELEAKLNEEIEMNVKLNKMLSESHKVEVLNQMIKGLTDTQADKLKTLAEGVSFDNIEEYAEKITTLRESYFPSSGINAPRELDSIEAGTEGKSMIAEDLNGPMANYVRALGKTLPK